MVNKLAQMLLIEKLEQSFVELENSINHTFEVLSTRPNVPQDVLSRVNTYKEMVDKQRLLTKELKGHFQTENWDEVVRHVKLINGYSGMIRDDAREILATSGLNKA